MEDPRIIAPRVPFIDPRTNTISREWFHWLLSLVTKVNTVELSSVFNNTTNVTNEVAQPAAQQSARLISEVPTATPQVGKRDVQNVELIASVPQPTQQVSKRDIQDTRLVDRTPRIDAELSKRVDGLAIQLAQLNSFAASIAARLQDIQLQAVMPDSRVSHWTFQSAATVSPTSPNRTLKVAIAGTPYYIHAKTTND